MSREEEFADKMKRVRLEALDDFFLADDVVEALRSILLDPDFLHRRPNARRIRRMRNKPLAWRSKNLSERDLEEVGDRRDRIDQRRRGTSGEEKSHGATAFVDDERPAVSTLRDEVAHDLFAEHRRLAAVVHLDGRIECGDAALRDPARAPALPNAYPELCVPGTGDAADPENVPRHGSRVDRLRDRGIDEVHLAGRGPAPFGAAHIGCLRGPKCVEPPGLDEVRPDSAERLRDAVAVPQLWLRPLRLDKDDDARLPRLAAADHFVPDRHADHVRASEDRGLVRGLHGPHAVPRHVSPLPLERADFEEAFSELPAGRRPRDPDDHVRDEPQEYPDPIIG